MEGTNIYDSQINATHLYQGDIFARFDNEFEKQVLPDVEPSEIAFMVLNYTCDLINKKDLSHVFICPIFKLEVVIGETLKILKEKHPQKSKDTVIKFLIKKISEIFKYEKKFFFFLAKTPEFEGSHAFADLLRIATIPVEYIKNILESRIKSLKSPWREKLGWKMRYLINRVGLTDTTNSSIEDYLKNHSVIRNYLNERID